MPVLTRKSFIFGLKIRLQPLILYRLFKHTHTYYTCMFAGVYIIMIYISLLFVYMMKVLYILESNLHSFYTFRGLKNQMRIRFAVDSWILEK
jgi:hypothetical protein